MNISDAHRKHGKDLELLVRNCPSTRELQGKQTKVYCKAATASCQYRIATEYIMVTDYTERKSYRAYLCSLEYEANNGHKKHRTNT